MAVSVESGAPEQRARQSRGRARLVLARLGFLIAALFGVVTLSFLLISITPGDPARVVAGPMASQSQIDTVNQQLGLDGPIHERYFDYMKGLVHGDLGISYYSKQPVTSEIGDRLPATLELIVLAVLLAAVVGISVGSLGAYFRGRIPDRVSRLFTGVFQAVPDFFLGLLLIYLLFFELGWAPSPSGQIGFTETAPDKVTGFVPIDALIAGDTALARSAVQHLVLPVLTLALVYAAYFAKTSRTTVGRALNSQQAEFARAIGLPERTVVRYAFVESRTTIVTYGGIIFATLIGGEAIVERVFSWDGLGTWALDGILRLDVPVIQGMVLVAGSITLITYTVLDIVVGLLDPRISHA